MKAEQRLWIKGHDGKPFGPVRWTSVREWVALGYFTADDEVRRVDEAAWTPIRARVELLTLPPGSETDDALNETRARARQKKDIAPRAAAYLRRLGCPVALERLNPTSAFYWVRLLEEAYPDRTDETEHWAAEEESLGRTPAATQDDATAEQWEILHRRGLQVRGRLSRLEARRLISGPPTEEQLEQLKFCGITLPEGACKDEAAEILVKQLWNNWSSEEAFQAHRRRVTADGAGPASPWKLREPPAAAPVADAPPAAPALERAYPPIGNKRGASRRGLRAGLVGAGLALALAGFFAVWFARQRSREQAAAAVANGPGAAPAGAAAPGPVAATGVTILEAPTPELGEKLRQWVAALEVSGIVGGAEPRALIDGRLYRVGDALDPARGIAMVKIDPAEHAIVFVDAAGCLVRRVVQ